MSISETWPIIRPNTPIARTAKKIVIRRVGYRVKVIALNDGECRYCGYPVSGIWKMKV